VAIAAVGVVVAIEQGDAAGVRATPAQPDQSVDGFLNLNRDEPHRPLLSFVRPPP
jgi:hypothetical protein